MAKYRVIMIVDGDEVDQDEIFDSVEQANEFGG